MPAKTLPEVELFTDGACRRNPGSGGWGVILRFQGQNDVKESTLHGGTMQTTNNRMELQAAIEGLKALKLACRVLLVTDSQYLINGLTQWLDVWKRRRWRTRGGVAIKNQDLWEQLDALAQRHQIRCQWVKGHANHPENERADQLANRGIDEMLSALEL